jgi:DNA-binding CsgD family transcriptional regulator
MTITTLLWVLLVPAVILIGVALWLSESRQQRIQRLHRSGYSQARIAQHLNISRYAVRKALAT